ncbi:hypothetical protein MGG_06539 [Pyricularia oryzae 70-15]|uniref:Semialdehyde dehydrogenase NAD-binding domain-containing protein n=4 Tax=Pyricularia oryzae TaxID=318829 RepID=G4N6L4_PYRO7|nr:uncharacterized protein MGG_06539 [Pyricularia oryzae 70-15]ELQ44889.1 hypothetical protein OOU_Y34scaffold00037g31 [Pyricularia oryzae Y34]KAI7918878.1 hypothetical protein M9X92_006663 [Pyricularia oryzae]EHA50683.1 hypothetical protein MGG_06539 [Pyricularia oryzae 70-15]KAI7920551.1 hypothetical protein M0657_006512 [Pyricularia oryzae]QBZ61242.1 hypothetical protein PoMZ_08190 [Pyricularia oryzae]
MDGKVPRVVLAGATGNVGTAILKHLVAGHFRVTVITRKDSGIARGEFTPPKAGDVTVQTVDYSSVAELTDAVRDHDAVVDATRGGPEDDALRLMDAAAAAGVYRFVPSEYGLDPLNAKTRSLLPAAVAPRVRQMKHLWDRCAESGMTWTVVSCGVFLDWALRNNFAGIDIFNRKATLLDGGANVTPWTTLDDVGKAVAEVLLRPLETENRPVYVHSVQKSCQEMLKLCQDAFGTTNEDWAVDHADARAEFDRAEDKVKAGEVDGHVFQTMMLYMLSQPDMAHPWPKSDNELLRVKEMSDAELMELVRHCFKRGPILKF